MPSYLITGDPGAGKSAVAKLLAGRGYAAYDTDDLPDVTRLEDRAGKPADWPQRPVDWSRYRWNWQEAALRKLLTGAGPVFVAAVVSNQERYYCLFDMIFVLVADPATLRRRLAGRGGNDYGKHPDELAGILDYHEERVAELLSAPHAVAIDATRPLEQVADDILARTSSP